MASIFVDQYNPVKSSFHSNLNETSSKAQYSHKPVQLRSEAEYLSEIKALKEQIE
jgi:hypothetical protein